MKAEELMIGDWVYSTFSDKPCQVIGIELYEQTGYANVKVTNVVGAKDVASLTPIPLTPEILQKNGWYEAKLNGTYGRRGMRLDGYKEFPEGVDNALSFAQWSIDPKFEYHLLEIYMWKGCIHTWVEYVHQLQNAFHLYGIYKDIIL